MSLRHGFLPRLLEGGALLVLSVVGLVCSSGRGRCAVPESAARRWGSPKKGVASPRACLGAKSALWWTGTKADRRSEGAGPGEVKGESVEDAEEVDELWEAWPPEELRGLVWWCPRCWPRCEEEEEEEESLDTLRSVGSILN